MSDVLLSPKLLRDWLSSLAADDPSMLLLSRNGNPIRLPGFASVRRRIRVQGHPGVAISELSLEDEAGAHSAAAWVGSQVVMDRFVLASRGDPSITNLLFDMLGNQYESFVDVAFNVDVAETLIRAALGPMSGAGDPELLDFGCGSGLALRALERAGRGRPPLNVRLTGTDRSGAMLKLAQEAGMSVIGFEDWKNGPAERFDGAFACFVAHYGIPADDFREIARQLRIRGRIVLNMFKCDGELRASLQASCADAGLTLVDEFMVAGHGRPHPALVFERVRRG